MKFLNPCFFADFLHQSYPDFQALIKLLVLQIGDQLGKPSTSATRMCETTIASVQNGLFGRFSLLPGSIASLKE